MKVIVAHFFLIICLTSQNLFGQWVYKIVKSDFDGEFKKAYTSTFNGGYLAMEEGNENIDSIKTNQIDNIPYMQFHPNCCLKDLPVYKYIVNDSIIFINRSLSELGINPIIQFEDGLIDKLKADDIFYISSNIEKNNYADKLNSEYVIKIWLPKKNKIVYINSSDILDNTVLTNQIMWVYYNSINQNNAKNVIELINNVSLNSSMIFEKFRLNEIKKIQSHNDSLKKIDSLNFINTKYSNDSIREINNKIDSLNLLNTKTIKIKNPFMYLKGTYFCDDYTNIDFVLIVKGVTKKYELNVRKSKDSEVYYFDDTIWNEEFIQNFKNASKCLIRVNQEYCKEDYYEFVMTGSTSAFNFMIK